MKMYLRSEDPSPLYLQLYERLKTDIVGGVYRYGDRLPSKRLLAEENGVSVIPVEHCYELLAEEGYVEPRERSGYFVCYREDDFLCRHGVPEPALPPSPPAPTKISGEMSFSLLARSMRRVLAEYGDRILAKAPNRGCPELQSAIAGYLARTQGLSVRPEQIVIGAGAEYLYGLIVQLLGADRIYALEDPSYEKIAQVYRANGVTCELLPLGRDGVRSGALAASRATVLHVTPFHSFPSGVTASASKRKAYLRWAKERNGYIIEDNFDSELTVSRKNEELLFSLAGERVLYLNTFSKTVAPSIRVGYLVLPPRLSAMFDERLGFYSCTVPVFEQYVLAELIAGGDFERHINRVRRKKRRAI